MQTLDTSSKNLTFNTVMGLLYKPISMIISFIYVPIVLNYLGTEKYGIWATVLSILSWINYFDLGIGNGLRNKLTEAMSKESEDKRLQAQLVSSAYYMTSILVLIVIVVFFVLGRFVSWYNVFGVTEDCGENLYAVVLISVICVCIAFVLSLCNNICYALQKSHLCNLFGVIKQLFMLVSVFIASYFFQANLIIVSILYGGSSIAAEAIMNVFVFSKHKYLIPKVKLFDRKVGKSVTKLGLKFFIIQIAGLVLFATDTLIITNMFGPTQVTYYTTVNKMFTVIITLFSTAIQPFWSAIRSESSLKNSKNVISLIKTILFYIVLASFASLLLMFLFKPLAYIWLGSNLDYPDGLIFWMMVYSVIYIWCSGLAAITNGLEIMNGPMVIAVVQGVVNIPLSIFLGGTVGLGTVGVLQGTIGAMLISAVITPFWIVKELKKVRMSIPTESIKTKIPEKN